MFRPQVTVSLSDQDPAIFVPEPFGDDFEIDSGLNGVAAEEMAHGVVSPMREIEAAAAGAQGLLGSLQSEDLSVRENDASSFGPCRE